MPVVGYVPSAGVFFRRGIGMRREDREWIEGKFGELTREVVKAQVAIAKLQVKSGVWGAVAGMAAVVGLYFLGRL